MKKHKINKNSTPTELMLRLKLAQLVLLKKEIKELKEKFLKEQST